MQGAKSQLPALCADGGNYHFNERFRRARCRSLENQGVAPDGKFLSPSVYTPITMKCQSRAREKMPFAFSLSKSSLEMENSAIAQHIAVGRRVLKHQSWVCSQASDDPWDA
jgi:hypothetical protein